MKITVVRNCDAYDEAFLFHWTVDNDLGLATSGKAWTWWGASFQISRAMRRIERVRKVEGAP